MSDENKPEDTNNNDNSVIDNSSNTAVIDRGNTNNPNLDSIDRPTQSLPQPGFAPDMELVGRENKFGKVDAQVLAAGTANTGANANQFAALKVHGFSAPGSHLTSGLNFYTIYTTIDITPTGLGTFVIARGTPPGVYNDIIANSQYQLDKLVETISLRAQPVVMSQITKMATIAGDNGTYANGAFGTPVGTGNGQLPALAVFTPTTDFAPTAANGTYVWSLGFAIEHNGAWDTFQTGWTNSLNPVGVVRPAIQGGPTPFNTNPDLGGTISANLAYMAPAWVNIATSTNPSNGAATNTFTVVSQGPF